MVLCEHAPWVINIHKKVPICKGFVVVVVGFFFLNGAHFFVEFFSSKIKLISQISVYFTFSPFIPPSNFDVF